MPFPLSPLAIPDILELDLRASTAVEAVSELHAALRGKATIVNHDLLQRDLQAWLGLGSLCLSPEIALPHTRTAAVNGFVFAVGRSTEGVAFDVQHPSVRLVFLVAVPPAAVTEYLRWVANFSRTLRNPPFRQALLDAATDDDFRSIWSLSCERLAS